MPVPVPRCGLRTAAAAPRCGHCGTGVLCVVCAVRTVMTDVCVPPPTTASRRPGLRLAAARSRRSRRLAGAPRARELYRIYMPDTRTRAQRPSPHRSPHTPSHGTRAGKRTAGLPLQVPLPVPFFVLACKQTFCKQERRFDFAATRLYRIGGDFCACCDCHLCCSLARMFAGWESRGNLARGRPSTPGLELRHGQPAIPRLSLKPGGGPCFPRRPASSDALSKTRTFGGNQFGRTSRGSFGDSRASLHDPQHSMGPEPTLALSRSSSEYFLHRQSWKPSSMTDHMGHPLPRKWRAIATEGDVRAAGTIC